MKKAYFLWMLLVASTYPMCGQSLEELPLFDISQLTYEGAFRIQASENGISDLNYAQGPIAYNYENHSLFIVGHAHQQAIAEYAIPEIVKSETLSELNMVETPIQVFSDVLSQTADGNPEGIDRVGGLYYVNHGGQAKLIVNAYEYYDAPADNTVSTLIVNDANALETTSVSGYYNFEGSPPAHSSGWISAIPEAWQEELDGTHITGHSSGIPIISRASVGPSAFAFDINDALNTTQSIKTNTLLDFKLSNPLHSDLSNESKTNDIWTHLSRATYGFIVPGTRTYLTIGSSGGHESGICYKCTQDNGNLCGGYCTPEADDNYQYYWLWDMNDLVAVKNGTLNPYDVRPYDHGYFNTPFQANGSKKIGGGTFDPSTGNLYLSVQSGDTEQGTYARPPVIVVYNTNGEVLIENQPINQVEIIMYPNPTSGILYIEGLVSKSIVQVNDMSGKRVKTITTDEATLEVEMGDLSSGVYVVSVSNMATNQVYAQQIIKAD
ncbi:T9SS type A sorting domain-containing protein [Maribacter polysiphoniae]|uniref:Putative secreted protein (Por secretion system target) n=1 Tax=Maribacter polysiphoniae TaxID=429344 RepID=A0A316DRL1_9FLAO|nr:T9SS type A sorting domain-containing protein [Maribacter polysiphoniae]MBD1262806.1 T9SS type A sorting domain-containing protein [Maribacter polysiphoniae]PWK20118.1 putative secreted protein (Por secretion system target) [Maribacter polysiphoniae]